jgi:hypothetical protein
METLAEGERVSSLAVRKVEGGYTVASITYASQFPVGSPKARAPQPAASSQRAATVVVRALEEHGDLKRSPTVVSVKAESVGGIALASSPFDPGEAVLAWVGRDGGAGQVFLTRLGRSGEKLGQRMLTRSKGGCSDVALAAVPGAFIVSWLDERDGRAAIYAAKVGRDLDRVGEEHRIAESKGEASELRLLAGRAEVLLAWIEMREQVSTSGIFAARLAPDLSLRAEPTRVLPAPRTASSLQLTRLADGVLFGWVQTSGADPHQSHRGAALAWVDAPLRAISEPKLVALPADATAVALDCDDPSAQASPRCRVVVSGGEEGQLSIYGFLFQPNETIRTPGRLAAIGGVSVEDVSPVLFGERLFFAEDDMHGGGRVRMAKIGWR